MNAANNGVAVAAAGAAGALEAAGAAAVEAVEAVDGAGAGTSDDGAGASTSAGAGTSADGAAASTSAGAAKAEAHARVLAVIKAVALQEAVKDMRGQVKCFVLSCIAHTARDVVQWFNLNTAMKLIARPRR